MKKKIGTIIDKDLLSGAKQRAALEKRALSGLIEDALIGYLDHRPGRDEATHSLEKFSSHGGILSLKEINDILQEDMLAP